MTRWGKGGSVGDMTGGRMRGDRDHKRSEQDVSGRWNAAHDSNEAEAEGLSLEELSRVYGAGQGDDSRGEGDSGRDDGSAGALENLSVPVADIDPSPGMGQSADGVSVTPAGIVEAALFVGKPDGEIVSVTELAGLMRGVSESEILEVVANLNQEYERAGRAFRIVARGNGVAMSLVSGVARIQEAFYGKVREVKLSQAAIDCLALIAYQPGISREQIDAQRNQPSGALLSQLVRRRLIEVRREQRDGQPPRVCYHPTERFMELTGLDSLDDLPQVEEFDPSLPLQNDSTS
ncbi:MAG: SMC-Scp complex subunit ScpB [Planctomycetota bacterium]|nr:MAG: SMC-Scp complex subunit ScpB [Planctomycetota bacterium]